MVTGWTTQRWFAALLALGAATVLVTSCSDDDQPNPSVTSSAVTSSPVDVPAIPVAPAAEASAKNAKAFVQYFWDVNNYSYAALDTKLLESLSGPACKFCSTTIADVKSIREAGSRVQGSEIRLLSTTAPPTDVTDGIIVSAQIEQAPGQLVRKDGSVKKIPGLKQTASFVGLNWTGKKWLVDDVANGKLPTQ